MPSTLISALRHKIGEVVDAVMEHSCIGQENKSTRFVYSIPCVYSWKFNFVDIVTNSSA